VKQVNAAGGRHLLCGGSRISAGQQRFNAQRSISDSEVRDQSVSSHSASIPIATVTAPSEFVGVANDDDDDDTCIVCMSAKREVALVPCGHLILCSRCCHKLSTSTKKCPVCNGTFREAVKIYK
jgi:hypothetical protein